MCIDLNHYYYWEWYQSLTPDEAIADITVAKARHFTVTNTMKGYHQCPFDSDSQLLTTFITSFDRFRFLQALYGISSISQQHSCCMAEILEALFRYRRIGDGHHYDSNKDYLLYMRQFLLHCDENK